MHMKLHLSLLSLSALLLAACTPTTPPQQQADGGAGEDVLVCISQITSHPVFDDIVTGIKEHFGTEGLQVRYDIQNAQGDANVNQAIAQKFADGDCDIVMPLGTQSSQAIVHLIKDTPVVFGAVTDPVAAELVASLESPGANVTGTSDITLYKEALQLLLQLAPNVKTVGTVVNPGEVNSQSALAQTKTIAGDMGLTVVIAPANSGSEVQGATRAIAGVVDAFLMLPDNTVLAAQEAMIGVTIEAKKPFVTLDQSGVEKGALASVGTNYVMVGKRTAEVAMRVLGGESPGSIPVLGVTDADLYLNMKTADALGITFPPEFIASAKQVYR